MITIVLSCIIYVGGLLAQTYSGPPSHVPIIDLKAKPVMCSFSANLDTTVTPYVGVECFPCECEIIVYESFKINSKSVITVDMKTLKLVTSLKPTIVALVRENDFTGWDDLLTPGPDTYKKDAEILSKFATDNNILGFVIDGATPSPVALNQTYTPTVMENLPDYLKLLKFSKNAIIGVRVYTVVPMIKNPCINDFASLNAVVDYYDVCTFYLNICEPNLSMFITPIVAKEHGPDYQVGMEEVTKRLKETPIDYSKIYYELEIYPKESTAVKDYLSYTQVCSGSITDTWCIPHTKDYFDKGSYVKAENCGMLVAYVQLDDVNNLCGCGSYIGFKNIIAGYNGGSVSPCPKFDVGVESQ